MTSAKSPSQQRYLIVDEHPVVRTGVAALIKSAWPRAELVEAGSTDEAFARSAETSFDVVVLDPGRSSAEIADLIERFHTESNAPIVIFTANGGGRLLSEALKAGVRGYVRKDSRADDLLRAIAAARSGEFYVDPSLSSAIVLEEVDRTLSSRQHEILQMLANGLKTDDVATRLGLSTETVRTHTKRILAKLEASTRTQAVAIGLRYGLIR